MCGIIGGITKENVTPILLEVLQRLEYRGYDSAGIAVIGETKELHCIRTAGKVNDLIQRVNMNPISGLTGIGHTRWATHGKPSEVNAHPHIAENEIAIVHNGIIENHVELRKELIAKGCIIKSETDSELIAHLVYLELKSGKDFLAAIQSLSKKLKGAYAIGFIRCSEPHRLLGLRKGSPLIVGMGEQGNFICSDTLGLGTLADKVMYLEEGDLVDIRENEISIYDNHGKRVERKIHPVEKNKMSTDKDGHDHYMLKEILEQPGAISRTLQDRMSDTEIYPEAFGANAHQLLAHIKRIQIVACGTSYHAGLVGKFWIESLAQLPCQVEIASEYRYKQLIVEPDTLFITLSQSGETADTLAALQLAKDSGYATTLTICNVPGSSLVRESSMVLLIDAGPEIGVASTKSFTCQLAALLLLALFMGHERKILGNESGLIQQLKSLPLRVEAALQVNSEIKKISAQYKDKTNALFIARGINTPIAMEGALKLKEISYIHAESYPAGELKHGPLALVNAEMPIIALAPNDHLLEKLSSNLEEIQARGGKLLVFTDTETEFKSHHGMQIIRVPGVDSLLSPVIYSIPMQLLAYHVGVAKGTDIDQPRNLAKSVTVE